MMPADEQSIGFLERALGLKESFDDSLVDLGSAVYGAGKRAKFHLWDLPSSFWLKALRDFRIPHAGELMRRGGLEDRRAAQLRSMGLLGPERSSDEIYRPTTGGVRN